MTIRAASVPALAIDAPVADVPADKFAVSTKHPNAHVRLVGEDRNAHRIISRVREAMRKARVPQEEIDAYEAEAESGDFDKVLQTTMRWVNYDPPGPGASFRM
jgi:hypothetical protein